MLLVPKQLANMMENPNAMWSIFALGPAVLFVCYISACRGFFQGQSNMTPTSVSQVYEAMIVKPATLLPFFVDLNSGSAVRLPTTAMIVSPAIRTYLSRRES